MDISPQRRVAVRALTAAFVATSLVLVTGCVEEGADLDAPIVSDVASGDSTSLIQNHGWDPIPPEFVSGDEASVELISQLFDGEQSLELVFEGGQFVLDGPAPVVRPDLYACGGTSANTLTWDTMPRVMLQTSGWAFVLRPVWSVDYSWTGDAFPTSVPSDACQDQLDALGIVIPLHPTLVLAASEEA